MNPPDALHCAGRRSFTLCPRRSPASRTPWRNAATYRANPSDDALLRQCILHLGSLGRAACDTSRASRNSAASTWRVTASRTPRCSAAASNSSRALCHELVLCSFGLFEDESADIGMRSTGPFLMGMGRVEQTSWLRPGYRLTGMVPIAAPQAGPLAAPLPAPTRPCFTARFRGSSWPDPIPIEEDSPPIHAASPNIPTRNKDDGVNVCPVPRPFEPVCLPVRLIKREQGGVPCIQGDIGSTMIR